jgi:hypothetical protein
MTLHRRWPTVEIDDPPAPAGRLAWRDTSRMTTRAATRPPVRVPSGHRPEPRRASRHSPPQRWHMLDRSLRSQARDRRRTTPGHGSPSVEEWARRLSRTRSHRQLHISGRSAATVEHIRCRCTEREETWCDRVTESRFQRHVLLWQVKHKEEPVGSTWWAV